MVDAAIRTGTKAAAKKPAGVKATRNPEASRARILEAARIEFVTQGLNGARVDRIAEQSGVNKNLIYHYFGSKDALYLEVLERIYSGLRKSQKDDDIRGLPPLEGMRRLVGNTFDHFVATPDLIRLMSIENIHYAQHLKSSTTIKPLYGGLLDTLRTLLRRGQAEGLFRAEVDEVDLYLSISGLAYFFLSNQHTLSWLLDRDFVAAKRVAGRRRHVVEMVLSYLTQLPPEEAGRAEPEVITSEDGQ
ncbi:MAG: TetR/AcrR family transcriptional regulator [Phreatobacter sp.]